jgi:hypothetical protein
MYWWLIIQEWIAICLAYGPEAATAAILNGEGG